MKAMDVQHLLSARVTMRHEQGYEIVGTFTGIVTEPSFIVVDDDGKKHIYGQSVIADVTPFADQRGPDA